MTSNRTQYIQQSINNSIEFQRTKKNNKYLRNRLLYGFPGLERDSLLSTEFRSEGMPPISVPAVILYCIVLYTSFCGQLVSSHTILRWAISSRRTRSSKSLIEPYSYCHSATILLPIFLSSDEDYSCSRFSLLTHTHFWHNQPIWCWYKRRMLALKWVSTMLRKRPQYSMGLWLAELMRLWVKVGVDLTTEPSEIHSLHFYFTVSSKMLIRTS